jgi:23S rRNA pseudouridine1911/1915/1917 synthase
VVERGKVTVGDRVVSPEEHGLPLPPGAVVAIAWNRPGTSGRAATADRRFADTGLRILHEDEDVVVVDKPPGLLTDVAPGQADRDSVRKRLDARLAVKRPGAHALVCHRIDRDTSGCVVFALHPAAHAIVREQFANHEPERTYAAFVRGTLDPPSGAWEDWMRWDPSRMRQVPAHPGGDAVLASARYRTVASGADLSELEVRLRTGRRNQIRLHLQLRGHPLVGERIYLPPAWRHLPAGFPRQALHAARVVFRHPTTGRPVDVSSPLPPDLQALEARLAR